jgi:hypothetical protein
VGQVDLGLDLVAFRARWTGSLRGRLRVTASLEVGAYLDRLMLFDGTGMRLLLGDPHQRQDIEDRFALDFQFSGQIVDSNLTHPPSASSACPVKPS